MIPALAVALSLALGAPAPLPRPVKEPAPYTSPVGRWLLLWGTAPGRYEAEFRPCGICRFRGYGGRWISGTWTFDDASGRLCVDEFNLDETEVTLTWVGWFPKNCWRGKLIDRNGACELKKLEHFAYTKEK